MLLPRAAEAATAAEAIRGAEHMEPPGETSDAEDEEAMFGPS